MKKIITILALISSLSLMAQSNATVTIVSASPTSACIGETIDVMCKMERPSSSQYNIWFWFESGSVIANSWEGHYSKFFSMPKTVVNGDTIYTVTMQVPASIPQGTASVHHSITSANVLINCTTVGIEEHTIDRIPTLYYNMHGDRIEKQYNTLMIEQRGNIRRKIVILQ